MTRTVAAATLLCLSLTAWPASAADANAAAAPPTVTVPARIGRAAARPAVLPALYGSYVALQVYDIHSTRQGLARGATEANPLMQGVVGHPAAFMALKGGVAMGTILLAERLWKTNKAGAIAVMVASNSVAALVAARNSQTLRQLR